MAKKKKKINRKLLIGLIALGVVLAGGAVVYVYRMMPGDPDVEMRKGNAMAAEGKWEAASKMLRRSVNDAHTIKDPAKEAAARLNFADFCVLWLEKDKTLSQEMRIRVLRTRLDELESVLRLDRDNVAAQQLLSDMAWQIVQDTRDWSFFLDKSENQLRLTPDDKELYKRRAKAHSMMVASKPEELNKAAQDYLKVTQLEPENPKNWMDLADFYVYVKKPQDAEQTYQAALKVVGDSVALRAHYAQFLRSISRTKDAQAQFEQALGKKCQTADDYLSLATYYRGTTPPDLEKAAAAVAQVQQLAPADWRGYSMMAELQVQKQDAAGAAEALRQGLKNIEQLRDGKPVEELAAEKRMSYLNSLLSLHSQLAGLLLYRTQGDAEVRKKAIEEAKGSVAILEERVPNDYQTLRLKGRLALANDDVVQAEQLLRKAISMTDTPDPETAVVLVGIYLQQNQLGEADRILKVIGNAYPDDLNILFQRAQLQLAFHKTEDAIQLLNHIRQLKPTGDKLAALQTLELSAMQQAGGKMPEIKIPDVITEDAIPQLLWYAGRLVADENPDKAAAVYRAILKQHPKQANVAAGLAALYMNQNAFDQATVVLQEGLANSPDDARLKLLLSVASAPTEDERDRLAVQDIETRSQGVQREIELAQFFRMRGKVADYQKHLEAAVAIDNSPPRLLEQLFNLYINSDQLDKAELLLPAAKEKNVDGLNGQLLAARLQLMRDQYDQAVATLQAALADRGPFSAGQAMLGEAFMGKGDLDSAISAFNTSYQQNPSNPVAVVGLARATEMKKLTDQHEQWVALAVKLGAEENPYIKTKWQEIQDRRQKPAEAIQRRELLAQENQKAVDAGRGNLDAQNLLVLASLYQKLTPPDNAKAEAIYKSLYEKTKDKPGSLPFVRLYADFLARDHRASQGAALFDAAMASNPDKVGSRLQAGSYVAAMGDAAQAEKLFAAAIEADPKDPRGYRVMAEYASNVGKHDIAMENLRKYMELKPDDKSVRRDLIRVQIAAGKQTEATAELEKILAENAQDVEALGLMGLACQAAGDNQKAREYLDKAIQVNPQDVATRLYRAGLYATVGNLADAAQDLREAYRVNPSTEILQRLASVYRLQKDEASERQLLQEAVAAQSDNLFLRRMLAEFYLRTQDWRPLEEQLTQAKAKSPTDPVWYLIEVQMRSRQGNQEAQVAAAAKAFELNSEDDAILVTYLGSLLDAKQYPRVIEVATPALEQRKNIKAIVQAMLARAATAQGHPQEGQQGFKTAFETAPPEQQRLVTEQLFAAVGEEQAIGFLAQWLGQSPSATVGFTLGQYYFSKGKWQQAKEAFQKGYDATTDVRIKAAISAQLGVTLGALGDYQGAMKAYQEHLSQSPDDVIVLNNLAYLMAASLKDCKGALPYIQHAAALAPQDPNVADTLGWVYFLNDNVEEAQAALEHSVDLKQASSNRFHLGQVLEKMGKIPEAKKQYRLGFDLVKNDPRDEFHSQLKERLDSLK